MNYITENTSESSSLIETLEKLRILATGWDKIFLDTQLRRYRIAKRDNKTFNLSGRERQQLAQITAKQGGEG